MTWRTLALIVLAAVLAACGGARAASAAPTAVAAGGTTRIAVVRGGVPFAVPADEPIPVAVDITARVRVTAVPGLRNARLLTLELAGAAGPLSDASVLVDGQMRYMDHGSFRMVATPSGEGRYVAMLALAMPGEWRLGISVTKGATSGELDLDLDTLE